MNPQAYGPCASTVPVQLVLDRSRAQPSRSRCNAQHQAVRGEPSRGPRRTSGRSCPKREELSQKVGGHSALREPKGRYPKGGVAPERYSRAKERKGEDASKQPGDCRPSRHGRAMTCKQSKGIENGGAARRNAVHHWALQRGLGGGTETCTKP